MVAAFGLLTFAATYLSAWARLPLPQGFMFVLVACVSAATAAPAQLVPQIAFSLVGGAIAWLVGMAGALRDARGPERRRVGAAYGALAKFADRFGQDSDGRAEQHALRRCARRSDGARMSTPRRTPFGARHEARKARPGCCPTRSSRARRAWHGPTPQKRRR